MHRIIYPETVINMDSNVVNSLILSQQQQKPIAKSNSTTTTTTNNNNRNNSFFSLFQTQTTPTNLVESTLMALIRYCQENNLNAVKNMLSSLNERNTCIDEILTVKSLVIDLEYRDDVKMHYQI